MSDDGEVLARLAEEVLKLLALYREAQTTMSESALMAFGVQFVLVDAMAQVALLPVSYVEPEGGAK